MSAILSADDLNDFISPGVACIKPVETLPRQQPVDPSNPYEVTTEDKLPPPADAPPASISLTDCLACSGCVTSAEAVLVSLQSHQEVASTLDRYSSISGSDAFQDEGIHMAGEEDEGRIFLASVSPQTRASLAALYNVSETEAGNMIEQLLAGPQGLKSVGKKRSGFSWVVDTNTVRELCIRGVIGEVLDSKQSILADRPKGPVLASACPGWICYAEKTHPHVLPHISRMKSPQALAGTLLKSVLSRQLGVSPDKIWHLAIMPCFDKKLEASREELTDVYWTSDATEKRGVRDVDCVITARELIMLADMRGISFPRLPQSPVPYTSFPDPVLDRFLFPRGRRRDLAQRRSAGSSGGYAYEIVMAQQRRLPGSTVRTERGRNVDVVEYILTQDDAVVMKTARYYGFRNIQNLVRKLKPTKKSRMPAAARRNELANGSSAGALSEYAYVEVMACPGGCTNGGGQVKANDVADFGLIGNAEARKITPTEQKEWLSRVDEAYFSDASEGDSTNNDEDAMVVDDERSLHDNGQNEAESDDRIEALLEHWTSVTGVPLSKLLFTSYRQVESDVGKQKGASDMDRVAGLASSIGGGW